MLAPKNLQFYPDGSVMFEYAEVPGDYRDNGMMLTRAVMVPGDLLSVIDELEELREAAQRALSVALREFSSSPAVDAEDLMGELPPMDDEPPGYDNPNERDEVLE